MVGYKGLKEPWWQVLLLLAAAAAAAAFQAPRSMWRLRLPRRLLQNGVRRNRAVGPARKQLEKHPGNQG